MNKINCDLLVAGAGIAGMCAAVAAARKGMKVVLINDRSVLGGNASSEIGVGISGANHHGLNTAIYAKECGLVEELRLMMKKYNEHDGYGAYALTDAVFFDFIYNEENITLLMNTLVEGCSVSEGRITSCTARHTVNNETFEIFAPLFVDSTGNGVMAYEAGAEFKIGRESKEEYNEFWAPNEADKFTMGNTIYFETQDMGHKVEFKAPKFAHDITKMEFFKDINKPENFRGFSLGGPHWAYEFGGQVDILKDHDFTELELRKLIYGIWDYLKNKSGKPEAENMQLKRVFAKAGTRESRRFIGEYVLNENDIENKVDFEDSVAIGGWPMDIHAPLGIYDKLPASNFVPVTGIYNIPFRSLYSKNIKNLMLAGRDISATHIALGSVRVMATCGSMGQAVGEAAYLCKKYECLPCDITKSHMEELQKILMYDDQTILHRIDSECGNFEACATSEKIYENTEFNEYIPLERDYALALMCDSKEVNSLDMCLKVKKDTLMTYKILGGEHKETYLPSELIKEDKISLKKSDGEWTTLKIDAPVSADGKIYIVLCKNENIEVAVSENRVMGAVTLRMHTKESHDLKNHDSIPLSAETGYTFMDHHYERNRNILFKNILPKQTVFAAKNAVNGYSRPYGTQNIWIPQTDNNEVLTLKAKAPVTAKKLIVIVDNDLHTDEFLKGMHKNMVKDMTVTVTSGDGEEKIFKIKDNYLRTSEIILNNGEDMNISSVKIEIESTYGDVGGIYGIRLK